MKHIRKWVKILPVVLVLAISGVSLFGQFKTPSDSKARIYWEGFDHSAFLSRLDSNQDGFISRQEWDSFFTDQDADNDQRLSRDEIQNAMRKSGGEEIPDPNSERIAAFDRLDANKNGKIDPAEWPGKSKDFRYIDSDHDGFLSREEFLSPNGRWRNETFENLDFSGDRVISRSEWLDSNADFDRLDRDRNGTIDRSEFYKSR
jgi:Ca2+-binding EF-hand superfamily protein